MSFNAHKFIIADKDDYQSEIKTFSIEKGGVTITLDTNEYKKLHKFMAARIHGQYITSQLNDRETAFLIPMNHE
jgi:hypothetical protein